MIGKRRRHIFKSCRWGKTPISSPHNSQINLTFTLAFPGDFSSHYPLLVPTIGDQLNAIYILPAELSSLNGQLVRSPRGRKGPRYVPIAVNQPECIHPWPLSQDVFLKLIFALFGLYVWELSLTWDFEWSLINGRRKFRWPLVCSNVLYAFSAELTPNRVRGSKE